VDSWRKAQAKKPGEFCHRRSGFGRNLTLQTGVVGVSLLRKLTYD
jgi:hypothetical protein